MTNRAGIFLTKDGIQNVCSKHALQEFKREFEKNHYIRLRGFIPSIILKEVNKQLTRAKFSRLFHKGISTDLCMRENAVFHFLRFLINDYQFFDFIEKISACPRIGCFNGRVYRMFPETHYDDWHDDWTGGRKIAMTVNLSDDFYEGGDLLLRYKGKPETEVRIPNRGFGDAVLFRLRGDLEHLVARVEGDRPKTAYAGWFTTQPDFLKTIRGLKLPKSKIPVIR